MEMLETIFVRYFILGVITAVVLVGVIAVQARKMMSKYEGISKYIYDQLDTLDDHDDSIFSNLVCAVSFVFGWPIFVPSTAILWKAIKDRATECWKLYN